MHIHQQDTLYISYGSKIHKGSFKVTGPKGGITHPCYIHRVIHVLKLETLYLCYGVK